MLDDLDLYFENLSVMKQNGNVHSNPLVEEFKTPIEFAYIIEPGRDEYFHQLIRQKCY